MSNAIIMTGTCKCCNYENEPLEECKICGLLACFDCISMTGECIRCEPIEHYCGMCQEVVDLHEVIKCSYCNFEACICCICEDDEGSLICEDCLESIAYSEAGKNSLTSL